MQGSGDVTFRWACEACGELHGADAKRCRNCEGSVFRPLSLSELEDRTSETNSLPGTDVGRTARDERLESRPTTTSADLDELLGGSAGRPSESDDPTPFPRSILFFVLLLALALALWYLLI